MLPEGARFDGSHMASLGGAYEPPEVLCYLPEITSSTNFSASARVAA